MITFLLTTHSSFVLSLFHFHHTSAVMVLWACLLLVHQRNSVWVIDGERRGEEEGADVGRDFGVQGCREGGGVGGNGMEVSLAEFF